MDTVLRAFSATVDDVNTTERSMVAKINSARLDRYRTVIDPRGGDFRNYAKTPVVLWCHGKDVKNRGDLPVGRNLWIRADKGSEPKVIAKTRFHNDDFSQLLYEAYRDGDITGWSISMLPIDFGPPSERELRDRPELTDCEVVYRTWEMAEYSCVPCPGNPDCITIDEARSLGKLVSRGLAIPDDYMQAVERVKGDEEKAKKPDEEACEDKDKEDEEEETEDRKACNKEKAPESKRDVEPVETRDVPESVQEIVEEMTEELRESIIELPPLVGRTFQQVFDSLRGEEIEYRRMILAKMQEHIDWYQGKV